jgi:membrane fusion protein (multidrug efflux system)
LGASEPASAGSDEEQEQTRGKKRGSIGRRIAVVAVAAVLVAAAIAWWLHSRRFESTDDAQIDGDITAVSARVAGTVIAVHVQDNQVVSAGAPLVELDPADLRVSVGQARAAVVQAEANARLAQSQRRRAGALLSGHSIPRDTFDQRASAAEQAQAALEVARARLRDL